MSTAESGLAEVQKQVRIITTGTDPDTGNSSKQDIIIKDGDAEKFEVDELTVSKIVMSTDEFQPTKNGQLLPGRFSDITLSPTRDTTTQQYSVVDCLQKYDTFVDNYSEWLSQAADANGCIQLSGATTEVDVDHITCQNVDVPGTLRIGSADNTGAALGEDFVELKKIDGGLQVTTTALGAGETALQVDDVLIKFNDESNTHQSLR